jgi:Protein of unknown function (DUF3710)
LFRRRRDAGEGRHEARPAKEARSGRHERRAPGADEPDEPFGDLAGGWDDQASAQDPGNQDPGSQNPGNQNTGGPSGDPLGSGPWDSADQYPKRQRIDVGSLLVPVNPGQDLGLELSDDQSQFVAVSVDIPDGKLQVRAMAAPKTGNLWEDERIGIITEVNRAGGQAHETDGPFGPEVEVLEPAVQGSGQTGLQPARFIGVDGPRWLLVGKISGPVAVSASLARPLEEVFADIVVVRGDHPAVPRDVLEILLPTEMRDALAQQVAQTQADQQQQEQAQFLMPIERGPEITETR